MNTPASALLFRHRSLPLFPGGIAAMLFIVLAMPLAGCATYRAPVVAGVQAMAEDSFEIKVTERTDRREPRRWEYIVTPGKASTAIRARIEAPPRSPYGVTTAHVVNRSRGPLRMNYYADKWTLYTVDGVEYDLAPLLGSYPLRPLNPGESARVHFHWPRQVESGEVRAVHVVLDFGRVQVIMLPLPQVDGNQ